MKSKNQPREGRTLDVEQLPPTMANVEPESRRPANPQPRTFKPEEQDALKSPPPSVCVDPNQPVLTDIEMLQMGPKPLRGLKWLLGLSLAYVVVIFFYQAYELIITLWSRHWSVGLALLSVFTALFAVGCTVLISWLKDADRFANVRSLQQETQAFREGRSHGQSHDYLQRLTRFYRGKPHEKALLHTLASLPDYADDRETLTHIERHFLARLDKEAYRQVSKYSVQTGVGVALSPWAPMDMLLTLWRNIKMIEAVTKVYGIRPNLRNRLKITTFVLNNIAFAGASQSLLDASNGMIQSLSESATQALLSTVGANIGQGVGAALITARVGSVTISACRPIPFAEGQAPKVKDFLAEIKLGFTKTIMPQG